MLRIFTVAAATLIGLYTFPSSAWEPTNAIEIVVPAGAGGGVDRTGRAVQRFLESENLVNVPINIVNKPGGSAAVGMAYAVKLPADGHHFMMGHAGGLITNKIAGRNKMNFEMLEAVAQLYSEPIAFSAKAGGDLKSGEQLMQILAEDTGSLAVGLPSIGSTNHISLALAVKSVGGDPRELNTIVFNSSSKAITAVLGDHIDMSVTPAGNVVSHLQAKTLNVLTMTSTGRLEGGVLANVTPISELGVGVDSVIASNRSIWAPKGMPREAFDYWQDVFKKLSMSKAWLKFQEEHSFVSNYLPSKEYYSYMQKRSAKISDIMTELGLKKDK